MIPAMPCSVTTDFPLTPDALVFDLGAYIGGWTVAMAKRHSCRIHAFEPVRAFYDALVSAAAALPKITTHNFGLAPQNCTALMNVCGDASSLYVGNVARTEEVTLVSIDEFLAAESITAIDLMKINIEGAEYDLLDHMLVHGLIPRIATLLIQFHGWPAGHEKRYKAIVKGLRRTHTMTGDATWATWRRRADLES